MQTPPPKKKQSFSKIQSRASSQNTLNTTVKAKYKHTPKIQATILLKQLFIKQYNYKQFYRLLQVPETILAIIKMNWNIFCFGRHYATIQLSYLSLWHVGWSSLHNQRLSPYIFLHKRTLLSNQQTKTSILHLIFKIFIKFNRLAFCQQIYSIQVLNKQ